MWLIALSAAVGPVYWMPGVDHSLLRYAKFSLLGLLLLVAVTHQLRPSRRLLRIAYALLACALATTAALLASDSVGTAVKGGLDFLIPLVWLVTLSGVRRHEWPDLFSKLSYTLVVFPLVAVMAILAGLGLIPDFQVPRSLLVTNPGAQFLSDYGISGSGLGGSRTGWGSATAIGTLMLVALLAWKAAPRWLIALCVVVTIAGLVQMGARGALAIFLVSAVLLHAAITRRSLRTIFLSMAVSVPLIMVWMTGSLDSRFYLDLEHRTLSDSLSILTSDRWNTWTGGVALFAEHPLVGAGRSEGVMNIRGQDLAVHNGWIRIAAETGMVGLLPSIFLFFLLIKATLGRPASNLAPAFRGGGTVILAGLLVSMTEPSFPLGAFFNATLFWLVVAFRMSEPVMQRVRAY